MCGEFCCERELITGYTLPYLGMLPDDVQIEDGSSDSAVSLSGCDTRGWRNMLVYPPAETTSVMLWRPAVLFGAWLCWVGGSTCEISLSVPRAALVELAFVKKLGLFDHPRFGLRTSDWLHPTSPLLAPLFPCCRRRCFFLWRARPGFLCGPG